MNYTRDIAEEWPNFATPRIDGAAALHVHGEEERSLFNIVFGRSHTVGGIFALFLEVADDAPLARAIGFWNRHGDGIAPPAETWETTAESAGVLRRVALMQLPTHEDLTSWCRSESAARFQRLFILPMQTFDRDALLADLAEAPDISRREFRTRGFVPWVLRAACAHGAMVLRPEDGADGRPGMGVFGRRADVDGLRETITRPGT